MKAMVLTNVVDMTYDDSPLTLQDMPHPTCAENEIIVKIHACGVCHTELDEIEGRTPPAQFPIILGHQVVGVVEERGIQAHKFDIGDRIGIAWIYSACGTCEFCLNGHENLCPDFNPGNPS